MNIQDQIFTNYKELIESFLRMDFEFTSDKRLILNSMEVKITKLGNSIWRTSVITNGYKHQTDS